MSSAIPALMSDRLAAAMSHPTRIYAMTVFAERTATPREIADGLGLEINRVMHHIRKLEELECIELVELRPTAHGRVKEQHYRATEIACLDDEAWALLTPEQRLDVTFALLRMLSEDLNLSLLAGSFFDPDDNHLSRNPLRLDHEGWREVVEYLDAIPSDLKKIQERVDARLSEGNEPMPVKVAILQFRSPSNDQAPRGSRGGVG